MKFATAFLVAFLAIGSHAANENVPSNKGPRQPGKVGAPGQGPAGAGAAAAAGGPQARQGRGLGDFLGPFRSFFGSKPRGGGAGGAATGKQYGGKGSETQNKPVASPYDSQGFTPNFPSFNEGFGSEYGPAPPKNGKPLRPYRQAQQPFPQGPPQHYQHQGGPPSGGPGGPHGGPGGPFRHGQAIQGDNPLTHHTFGEPQTQHHHYHAFMNDNNGGGDQGQYNNNEIPSHQGGGQYEGQSQNYYPQRQPYEGPSSPRPFGGGPSGPRPYDGPSSNNGPRPYSNDGSSSPRPFDGPSSPRPFDGPQRVPAYEGLQPAQQFNRPSVARPGPGGPPPQEQFNTQEFEQPQGFGNFGGFGPSDFGSGGGGNGGSQAGPGPRDQGGFFGGSNDYPEQFEEQTRNTREPEIITADYLQNQGQGSGGSSGFGAPQGFEGGFNSFPSQQVSSSYSFPETTSTQASATPGPIFKSHPIRPSAGGHHRPSHSFNHGNNYGAQGESRPQPFLYRPVASSIRVPGAVDEDAVYGKPMMMSASNNKRRPSKSNNKFRPSPIAQASRNRPVYKSAPPTPAPFRKPEDIVTLDSPTDPSYKTSRLPSFQQGMIIEPDTAASGHEHGHGHGHGHGGGHHELENANGDRILYHVSGHQGPYSYRFGYDTGKGYNRMFRFEEKDGKGYVTGKYGFYDKHGKLNLVNYQAHPEHGFHAERDHGNHHQSHHINH